MSVASEGPARWHALEPEPERPGAVALPTVAGLAGVLHGPAPLGDRLAWLLARALEVCGADAAGYVAFEGEVATAWPPSTDLLGAPGEPAARRAQLIPALRDGAVADLGAAGELLALAAVAVVGTTGRRHGALLVGRRDRPVDASALSVAHVLAGHLAAALDHQATLDRLREMDEAQRELVHQLQDAVRPAMPEVPDTELGVYYLAADPQEPTGGDLYDWRLMADGSLYLAVVDVQGKGVSATKDALAVSHALRLLVTDGVPLEAVARRADDILGAQDPDLVATVVLGRYQPATGELRLAGAGHPPALVLRSDGAGELVHPPGVPIGFPGAGSEATVTVHLDRSDTVVLYTDGLVESGKDIVAGLDALVQAGQEVSDYPAEQLARSLVHRAIAGGRRRDDTVALVLRRRSTARTAGARHLAPFVHGFHAHPAAVGLARHLLSDWLHGEALEATVVEDLLLVAGELCANAVAAAPGAEVVLRACVDGDDVVVEVEDPAGDHPGLADHGAEHPDPLAERGRGLYLVAALGDDVEVDGDGGRTVVRCRKRAVVGNR